MVTIAIVDDERSELEHLQAMLERYAAEVGRSFKLMRFESGAAFLEACRSLSFDLVFLDVDMPAMNGFDAARKLRAFDATAVLIFVTNVAQMAIRGYEVNALDYLLKPLSYEAFSLKLPKALAQCARNDAGRIVVRTRSGQSVFPASSILYVASEGHHITYYTENGQFEYYGTMKDVVGALPGERFFRCNSGSIVNLTFVASCDGASLVLTNGQRIDVSRARRREFLEALQRYYYSEG